MNRVFRNSDSVCSLRTDPRHEYAFIMPFFPELEAFVDITVSANTNGIPVPESQIRTGDHGCFPAGE